MDPISPVQPPNPDSFQNSSTEEDTAELWKKVQERFQKALEDKNIQSPTPKDSIDSK